MTGTGAQPRVTLGIATYNRDTYLAQAIDSCLGQDYPDLEVLVVVDGSTNPAIDAVLERYADVPRLRVVRHERNLGIAAGYNTFVSEGRGELIAMLGDDDVSLPGRIRRQVEIFDRFPDTGIVHGDATIIDAAGRTIGRWPSRDFSPSALLQDLMRSHNHIVDPTRMVHRRVYERVGGYDDRFPLANDFDFWLRAAPEFRFRHCPGGPIVAVRRHGENTSEDASRTQELADVELALEEAIARADLRTLVPELDWAVLDPADVERQALHRLADALEHRALPVPRLAARLRQRAAPRQPSRTPGADRHLLMTAFGWNDSGGGTTVPRLAAKELARRGWEVTVFHAALGATPAGLPYEVVEWHEDGVRLVGVHNRPAALFDLGNPLRELDDPMITAAFEQTLDRLRPDVIHFHNLHNLGAALLDRAAARGLPAYFTTHNYWLICPRAYLLTGNGALCPGPGNRGADCARCVGSLDVDGHERRLAEIRARAEHSLTAVLAVSASVRRTLLAAGYPADLIDVVRQAMPHDTEIWEQVGRDRRPGRVREQLTVAFLGSAYPHKGPQLLVQAAQRTRAAIRVKICGEIPDRFRDELQGLDARGVVDFEGAFAPSEIGALLAGIDVAALPSVWWDCAPLAAAECRAARVPLLVPRLGGLPETIRHGIDGLVFDGLDADDLAAQMDRLAEEPGLLEAMQAAIDAPPTFAGYVDTLERYYAGARPGRAERGGEETDVAVRWVGDHGLATSLSIINDRVTARLPGPVQRLPRDGGPPLDPPLPHAADVEVRHAWPPDLRPSPSGRLAVIQPWEFGAIPRAWITQMRENVDEVWVPSEFVRQMYIGSGLAPDDVRVIPNGVDLDLFRPDGDAFALPAAEGTRFLFVGGAIWRKGVDILLEAWSEAFPGRDDVSLVVKDFGAAGVYRGADREPLRARAASGELPRVILIEDELTNAQLAGLYRACDVLVHPYRGEGFAMPVLEAMACGLPVLVTAGGPTDEFCPEAAGWRIAAQRVSFPEDRVDTVETAGRPWVLEPDRADLVRLLRTVAADRDGARRRGELGRAAAERLSWETVAHQYDEHLRGLAARPVLAALPRAREPFPLAEEVALRVLSTPAWRAEDRLGDLLAEWAASTSRTTSACLYLLADPAVDGAPEELERHVLHAAASAGADLERCGDINVLMEPMRPGLHRALHAAVDAYVPLHDGCAGELRLARESANTIVRLGSGELGTLLRRADPAAA